MALLHVNFFSRALGVASSVEVILPESEQGIGVNASDGAALPRVLYLLHGYSDDLRENVSPGKADHRHEKIL